MNFSPEYSSSVYESTPIWIAQLSDGQIAYQDESIGNSFLKLREYCIDNNLYITDLKLRFRSHLEHVYDGSGDGLFLRKSILGGIFDLRNYHSLIIGRVEKDIIYTNKWSVPELINTEQDERPIENNLESIIFKDKDQYSKWIKNI